MEFKRSLLVVATLCFAVVAIDGVVSKKDAHKDILNVIINSTGAMSANPTQSLKCFQKSIPLIEQYLKEYKRDYTACENLLKIERSDLENSTLHRRTELANDAEKSCKKLSTCQNVAPTEEFYKCYIRQTSESAKTMKSIENNMSRELFVAHEKSSRFENQFHECVNEVAQNYEQKHNAAIEILKDCISQAKESAL